MGQSAIVKVNFEKAFGYRYGFGFQYMFWLMKSSSLKIIIKRQQQIKKQTKKTLKSKK